MKYINVHTAVAACWLGCCQQASAECGLAATYTPEGQAAHAVSAVHRSLPAGTRVVVRNQQKGRSIIVPITAHRSFLFGRIIDLSAGAMSALGMDVPAPVCLEVVSYGTQERSHEKPSLFRRLLEAVIPKRIRSAIVHFRRRSATARRGTSSANAHNHRWHYARVHH